MEFLLFFLGQSFPRLYLDEDLWHLWNLRGPCEMSDAWGIGSRDVKWFGGFGGMFDLKSPADLSVRVTTVKSLTCFMHAARAASARAASAKIATSIIRWADWPYMRADYATRRGVPAALARGRVSGGRPARDHGNHLGPRIHGSQWTRLCTR